MWKGIISIVIGILVFMLFIGAMETCRAEDARNESEAWYYIPVNAMVMYQGVPVPITGMMPFETLAEALAWCNSDPISEYCSVFTIKYLDNINCERDKDGRPSRYFTPTDMTF